MYDVEINLLAVANHVQLVHILSLHVSYYAPGIDSNRVQFM
jgi:hypothetical protein